MTIRASFVFGLIDILFVASTHLASAQAWRDGYVVTTKGDSLKGQLEFADPDASVATVKFRSGAGSAPVVYGTADINAFGLVNPPQRFERLVAQVTYYSRNPVPYRENPVVGIRKIDSFAEVVRAGSDLVLYSVYDDNRDERFFIRKNGELTELKKISYMVVRDSYNYKVEETPYQGQMKSLLSGCDAIKKKTYNYDEKSLGKAFDEYFKCKGETNVAKSGVAHQLLTFGGFLEFANGKSSGVDIGWGGMFGVSAQMLSRKNRGNQFLRVDLGLGHSDFLILPIYVGLSAGSYFGQGQFQPLINVGASSLVGNFNAGVGVGYKKRIVLTGNVNSGFLGETLLYSIKLNVYPRIRRE